MPRRVLALLARAAVVVVFVGASIWLAVLHFGTPNTAHAGGETGVVAKLVNRHLVLGEGQPPEVRFRQLAGMAVDLRDEALRIASDPEATELPALARLYERVVRDGLVDRASKLPVPQQRHLVRSVLEELQQTQVDAERVAATAQGPTAISLRSMAATAKSATMRLRELVGDKAL
jgi:hypothetical protein